MKTRPETRFACDRDRFACNLPRQVPVRNYFLSRAGEFLHLATSKRGNAMTDDRILQGTALMMVALSVWMVMALLAS